MKLLLAREADAAALNTADVSPLHLVCDNATISDAATLELVKVCANMTIKQPSLHVELAHRTCMLTFRRTHTHTDMYHEGFVLAIHRIQSDFYVHAQPKCDHVFTSSLTGAQPVGYGIHHHMLPTTYGDAEDTHSSCELT